MGGRVASLIIEGVSSAAQITCKLQGRGGPKSRKNANAIYECPLALRAGSSKQILTSYCVGGTDLVCKQPRGRGVIDHSREALDFNDSNCMYSLVPIRRHDSIIGTPLLFDPALFYNM